MQFKETLVRLLFLIMPFSALSQTTYIPLGAKENILLDRLEIKAQTDSILNFSNAKPYSRALVIPGIQKLDSEVSLTRVDQYNLHTAILSNIEYASGDPTEYKSRNPFLNTFYTSPANFYQVNSKDFFLALNPVFQYVVSKENNNSQRLFLNTRGVTLRGRIGDKIGFSAYITDNQERDPLYVQELVQQHQGVPGEGYYKDFKGSGYDYFDARGYITTKATRFIDLVFGYDKNFIGNGYRSLFLSDFSNSALFFKINTRIWKFNYQNLFMELVPTVREPNIGDKYLGHKYAAIHHLDLGVTKWLNIGLFEAIIFGRENHFEFGYLNPVIFYRSIERENGSFDNSLAGLDAKANIAHHVQLYGQLLLDEFSLHELNKEWWGNKYGVQLGGKYVDAFAVNNLDLQLEWNVVRPFTYSHNDSVSNYTHNNQPLAHPLGANFSEIIGIARYQPAPKWMIEGKLIHYMQGRDTGSTSFGSNIFLPDLASYRSGDYGYVIGSGIRTNVNYSSLLLSYELKPNFFIEGSAVIRNQQGTIIEATKNEVIISAGVRWNVGRREFAF
jgi:hypothetical protein